MKIRFTIDGKELARATLRDNPTARDFLALLPVTVTVEDYASTEKIAYLPKKLSTEGAPAGSDPAVGDIAYYAPWGNLAMFYMDGPYACGLLPFGRIDSSIEVLRAAGTSKVTIERVPK